MAALRPAILALVIVASNLSEASRASDLPAGFVYLRDVAASIVQDIRYAGSHNFVGRPISGYAAGECILTEEAAAALSAVQAGLSSQRLSLIVWDCYRPARAVADFWRWSKDANDNRMKHEFFPRTDKSMLFTLGYLSTRSAHARGSTVDLGIVPKNISRPPDYAPGQPLVPCVYGKGVRFDDGTIDLGTGYDCLDAAASITSPEVTRVATDNRQMLRRLMRQAGFKPSSKEWWHFELIDEPYPGQEFDFPISGRAAR